MTIIPFKGKNMEQKFSDTARSERHFSAMLLPHLLLANNFAGLRALFRSLDRFKGADVDSNDIEIVAELNPIRDFGEPPIDSNIPQSVPDLFLRIGENVLVIEAKFFTYPSEKKIDEQITSQRKAIESRLEGTRYKCYSFHYLALTVHDELNPYPNLGDDMSHLTWQKVIEVLEPVVNNAKSLDLKYVLAELKYAVQRSADEQSKSGSVEEGRCKTIQELYQRAPELLAQGYCYIGFTGGVDELKSKNLDDLEKRDHYKYSSCKPNNNWVPMGEVILRYLKLKKRH